MNAQVKPQETIRVLEDVVIEQFNDTNVSLVAKEIEKQLALIGSKFGITLSVKLGKTTTNSMSARVSGFVASDDTGSANPAWKANYMRLCHLIGLTPDDFGRKLHNTNLKNPEKETYEIVGMTPKSLDLVVRNSADRYYRLPVEEARLLDAVPTPVVEEVKTEEVVQVIAKALDTSDSSDYELEASDSDDLDLSIDFDELDLG
jgi:hypothetical protein